VDCLKKDIDGMMQNWNIPNERKKGKNPVSSTWSWGNFTCTGEQRSTLSPTPTCPNYNRRKI